MRFEQLRMLVTRPGKSLEIGVIHGTRFDDGSNAGTGVPCCEMPGYRAPRGRDNEEASEGDAVYHRVTGHYVGLDESKRAVILARDTLPDAPARHFFIQAAVIGEGGIPRDEFAPS